jgi:UDP-N-acetylglucosamine 2-epimerase (non-hydrolysing)
MAAYYSNTKVAHVEAGLRTNNIRSPFPEEFNRQVIAKIATYHYAPTDECKFNLMREAISESNVIITGNTVIDALHLILSDIESNPIRKRNILSNLESLLGIGFNDKKYILITGHRRENFGEGFIEICMAIKHLALKFPDFDFIYPVHLNPNVQNTVKDILSNLCNVKLIAPLDYEAFVYLLKYCFIVLTDSGGIQEEAPSLGKPVLVMRDTTERPEAVEAGTVILVGANRDRIISNASDLIIDTKKYLKMSQAHNPYGDGKACYRIISHLKNII